MPRFYANKEFGPETVIKHCVQQDLKYVKVTGNEISDSAKILANSVPRPELAPVMTA